MMAGDWHVSASEDREVLSDWIGALLVELEGEKPAEAFLILKETLHAIRDFLPVDRALVLSDMLPFIIRCIFLAGWTPGTRARLPYSGSAFLDRVGKRCGPDRPIPTEDAVIAVLAVLSSKLSGEGAGNTEVFCFRDLLETRADA